MQKSEEIEQLCKFEEDYTPAQLSINWTHTASDYFKKLTIIKLELISKYGDAKKVLEIGCGTGDYLFESKNVISEGIGIDFSTKAINEAILKRNRMNIQNIDFIICNAKQIPCNKKNFDLIYSYSTLYVISDVEQVIFEIARLLKSNSIAILDFGNLYSLNTMVCRGYPELAICYHLNIKDITKIIKNAGLKIIETRRFQILPLWGDRPKWIKPLLNPLWKKILEKKIKDKMIDEWICNMPLFKSFAFRHIIVCQKE